MPWPELGWQKIGIHELVSSGQFNVRYTNEVAKLCLARSAMSFGDV